jgi:hypothetical protein
MWNTTDNQNRCIQINCCGNNYNFEAASGLALVEKIKSVARENHINKFDIYDSTGENITPEDIEAGDFTAPLTVVRFNVAAVFTA